MKKIIIIISILILLGIGLFFILNNNAKPTVVQQKPLTLPLLVKENDGQLIDVREPSEYETNHADGAINVPLGNILKNDFTKIDINKPVFIYCRTGVRAGKAKVTLEKSGYKNVTNVGGLSSWQNQGGLVCKSSQSAC